MDFHCHPNLKTFGHSFGKSESKMHLWNYQPPTRYSKIINALTGLSRFSQADFTSMTKGGVRVAFVSLYPFEKGFFNCGSFNGPIAAMLANEITGIGYKRVRHIQKHMDYFTDLKNEYSFMEASCKEYRVDGNTSSWEFGGSYKDVQQMLLVNNRIVVIPTIEGAHVLNTGLATYGKEHIEEEVLRNIVAIKQWRFPPLFVTFAHNFNNDLCGHARSLERLGSMVDQSENLGKGFTDLGRKVLSKMLDYEDRPIFIDIKHMSVVSRMEYFRIVEEQYLNKVPIVVSHGAVTGISLESRGKKYNQKFPFSCDDINFYDEELVAIANTNGIFAIQLDANRLADSKILHKSIRNVLNPQAHKHSAWIVWNQLQHIAEVLDKHELFAWGMTAIGSDFDGTINPLNGIWTEEHLPKLAAELLILANQYLKRDCPLALNENSTITADEIVDRFIFSNSMSFLRNHYNR